MADTNNSNNSNNKKNKSNKRRSSPDESRNQKKRKTEEEEIEKIRRIITPIIFSYPFDEPNPPLDENYDDYDGYNEYLENEDDWEYQNIDIEIETVQDLIKIGEMYDSKKKIRYNIDVRTLHKLIKPLTKLDTMIGMNKVKNTVVEQIIYYLQGIDDINEDMLHSVIEGPPGVGKTEVAKILASIYKKMGILSSDKFKIVKRSDLIGGYLGQTAIKTQKILDECNGGVLFIDEAYSLGNSEGRDSYSKECIDTITAYLSENKRNFICIIAGYKKSLQQCFFNYNEGLERRFPYRFEIDTYNPEELRLIFFKIVREHNWDILDEKSIPISFFETNKDYFIFNGGDMEILFHKCKIAHSKRVFTLPYDVKKKLTIEDLDKGLQLFLQNDEIKKRKETEKYLSYYS